MWGKDPASSNQGGALYTTLLLIFNSFFRLQILRQKSLRLASQKHCYFKIVCNFFRLCMQMFSEDSKTTVQVDMCQKTICIDEQNVQVTAAVTSIYESNDKQLAENL